MAVGPHLERGAVASQAGGKPEQKQGGQGGAGGTVQVVRVVRDGASTATRGLWLLVEGWGGEV